MAKNSNYKDLYQHAATSQNENRIKSLINLVKSESGIPININELDKKPYFFNCNNGTIDLKSGEFSLHKREDYLTQISNVNYESSADCPMFKSFINQIMGNDKEMVDFIQRILGYSITGSNKEQCIFFLIGNGSNGKSTLTEIINFVLGEYATTTNVSTFTVKNNTSNANNDLARLKNIRFVSTAEPDKQINLSESIVKLLTGNDMITARFLYEEFFEYTPIFKIFLLTNYLPKVRSQDEGIWRRLVVIPFDVNFEGKEDKDLLDKLKTESSGILNWLIEGCLQWQKQGLTKPQKIVNYTKEYRNDNDIVKQFISSNCITGTDFCIKKEDLYFNYKDWCKINGHDVETQRTFTQYLYRHGITEKRTANARYYNSIQNKSDCEA